LFAARLLKPARQNQLFETLLRCIAPAATGATPPANPIADVKKGVTILVADDNAVNLKVACAMLLKLGYEIRTATNGREAVEALAHAQATGLRLGAILMDVNMPEVDGLEATRQIRSAWGAGAPPIIALTAAASTEDQARCQDAGMDDYLTKPLHVAALAQTLESWLARGGAAVPSASVAGTAAPEATRALVEFGRLEEFREFDDESLTMTREVIGLFLTDTPVRLNAIDAALETGDALALAQAAHALKGSASNVGAVALQGVAATLEADAQEERLPADAAAVSKELRELADGTRDVLAKWSAAAV